MDMTTRRLWLYWLPTCIGFFVGGELAVLVVGRVDSPGSALVGGALAGAVIGGGQWLVLRNRLARAGWWIPATAAGQAIGLVAGAAIVGYGTDLDDLMIQGAVTGLAIGTLQALVLRRNGASWHWWALAMPPLWALGWAVTWSIGVDVEAQYTTFGSSGAIVVTALSGLLMAQVLRDTSHRDTVLPVTIAKPA
jgi:hypothetical protein